VHLGPGGGREVGALQPRPSGLQKVPEGQVTEVKMLAFAGEAGGGKYALLGAQQDSRREGL
jgi:hypothetical protein